MVSGERRGERGLGVLGALEREERLRVEGGEAGVFPRPFARASKSTPSA